MFLYGKLWRHRWAWINWTTLRVGLSMWCIHYWIISQKIWWNTFPTFIRSRRNRSKSIVYWCIALQAYQGYIVDVVQSATLVISYLMRKHQWGFKQAIAEVRRFRPEVLPNLGFERQLKEYEKELNSSKTVLRKNISKTSESKKHHMKNNKKQLGLPEIIGFGKTILPHKYLESNSMLGTNRMKLPQFVEEEGKKSVEIKNLAMKSFKRRSISDTNRKMFQFDKKVSTKDGNKSNRIVPSIN